MSATEVETRPCGASLTRGLSPPPVYFGSAIKRSKRGSNSWCRTDDGTWVPEGQVPAAQPVERPRVDSTAPLSKLVRTLSIEMPPPPALAPAPATVPMSVAPPLPAACSGFASMDSAVLAASTSIPSASFNNVWRPQPVGQGFTTGSGVPPPLTNAQSLPTGFPTAATTDWVPPDVGVPPAVTTSKSAGAVATHLPPKSLSRCTAR